MLAYYCLHELRLLPSQVNALSEEEKAFIEAAIELKRAEQKRQRKQLERSRRR